jgi:iron only hydrogenase large subunit-like protein
MKNNIQEIESELKKTKMIVMLAPSFIAEFNYPSIIIQLKELGFDKVVELTFGAKMINRLYHEKLENSKQLVISSVCPGIVQTIKSKYSKYKKNLIRVDSPMVAMSKICKKIYPKHKTVFISPCNFKKIEAENSKDTDYVIDYIQLKKLFDKHNIKQSDKKDSFDKFYNEYTRIYPISGGLSKTAHLKGVLKPGEEKLISGISELDKFFKKPDKNIKFLDANFCIGACIGGTCTSKIPLEQKKQKVLDYLEKAKHENIPKSKQGLIKRANGIKFTYCSISEHD